MGFSWAMLVPGRVAYFSNGLKLPTGPPRGLGFVFFCDFLRIESSSSSKTSARHHIIILDFFQVICLRILPWGKSFCQNTTIFGRFFFFCNFFFPTRIMASHKSKLGETSRNRQLTWPSQLDSTFLWIPNIYTPEVTNMQPAKGPF